MATSGPPPRPGTFLSAQQYYRCEEALKDGLASDSVEVKDKVMQTVLKILERAAKGEYD